MMVKRPRCTTRARHRFCKERLNAKWHPWDASQKPARFFVEEQWRPHRNYDPAVNKKICGGHKTPAQPRALQHMWRTRQESVSLCDNEWGWL